MRTQIPRLFFFFLNISLYIKRVEACGSCIQMLCVDLMTSGIIDTCTLNSCKVCFFCSVFILTRVPRALARVSTRLVEKFRAISTIACFQ
uniref:Putative secreted protein n=1 Tax=Anopheles marajoara TaxID=58244 RepID=A0A2M4CAI1_9DIPT